MTIKDGRQISFFSIKDRQQTFHYAYTLVKITQRHIFSEHNIGALGFLNMDMEPWKYT